MESLFGQEELLEGLQGVTPPCQALQGTDEKRRLSASSMPWKSFTSHLGREVEKEQLKAEASAG